MSCLVTKLKTVINNEQLDKIGEISFVIPAPSKNKYFSIGVKSGTSITMQIEEAGLIYSGGISHQQLTCTSNNSQYSIRVKDGYTPSTLKVTISNKYNLAYFALSNALVVGNNDVGSFSYCTNLTHLQGDSLPIIGNITALKYCLNLNTLAIPGSPLTGDIEDLAKLQVSNGRTSGTLSIEGTGVITYQGQIIPYPKRRDIIFSSSGYTISEEHT